MARVADDEDELCRLSCARARTSYKIIVSCGGISSPTDGLNSAQSTAVYLTCRPSREAHQKGTGGIYGNGSAPQDARSSRRSPSAFRQGGAQRGEDSKMSKTTDHPGDGRGADLRNWWAPQPWGRILPEERALEPAP